MSPTAKIVARLSVIDRFLPVWIFVAMGLGVALGRLYPAIGPMLDTVKVGGVSLPIAVGLFWMMYPVLAKVRYGKLGSVGANGKLFTTSLVFNWVIGPIVMFTLAWLLLPDLPHYRTGLILIGLARCIAMVLIWNMLAKGSNEVAALLVALNSVFQILFYSVLGWFYLTVLPGWLGAEGTAFHISMWAIAKSVLIFLGLPLVAGAATRGLLVHSKGLDWYESHFLSRVGPTALLGLLYTIVLMFAMQGDKIVSLPLDVVRISIPLVLYFAIMFGSSFFIAKKLGFSYEDTASLSFTAAGNNFELAIAVSVGLFGIASGEALAGVVGPLIEVPALLALVYLSLWLQRRLFPKTVLFACVHNAGRSQMAAAWFNELADPSKAIAISAGTEPGARVHAEVVEVMKEVGIDLAAGRPTFLSDDLARTASLLITMGCGEACPVVPGLRRDDWPLEDPKGKPVQRVREIRDEVRARVEALIGREGLR